MARQTTLPPVVPLFSFGFGLVAALLLVYAVLRVSGGRGRILLGVVAGLLTFLLVGLLLTSGLSLQFWDDPGGFEPLGTLLLVGSTAFVPLALGLLWLIHRELRVERP